MSKATKKKYVRQELLTGDVSLAESQQIVKIVASRGNNLHEVVTASGETFLSSMPSKFRRVIWIKRGDYVIVDPIEEGNKVRAEISSVLNADQIKSLKEENLWPEEFVTNNASMHRENSAKTHEDLDEDLDKDASESASDDDLFVNTNRIVDEDDYDSSSS
ncbi:putative RNA-binding protein EIF1AD [Trichoplax sp. H2]|uniref:Probable RNA-binding protein EIF1AD n=1 Tax=Trichoplax adhaerens TaxID=10228 RepID=B3S6G8_TRIAD|nr:hypothetical protein TRIADDRAFT_59800 [Trichoplax adhaerens]EDV21757.1 hypothetical protein TRIADDRAFT_59800 [Trichoplax adhaerens]RDD47383.1 putative RNA-binding protein EIF1AD [Trichoplax sp. H2]|eukprot:XP_002115905.1 hypothetical protein TRIADDRAFT_59800 [Trichoplax adhaerens]